MSSIVTVSPYNSCHPSKRTTPVRVTVDKYTQKTIVYIQMKMWFDENEVKDRDMGLLVTIPRDCVCFVNPYIAIPNTMPTFYVSSTSFIGGDDSAFQLSFRITNTTSEKQTLEFGSPIAVLQFVDRYPVTVNTTF